MKQRTRSNLEGKFGESVKLTADCEGSELLLEGTDIRVTAGRTPNTDDNGLDLAGVETPSRGYIKGGFRKTCIARLNQ